MQKKQHIQPEHKVYTLRKLRLKFLGFFKSKVINYIKIRKINIAKFKLDVLFKFYLENSERF